MMQSSGGRGRTDDESIDELAGEALLDHIPRQPVRAASLHSQILLEHPIRPTSSTSNISMAEDLDKSLPPIPHDHAPIDQIDKMPRLALATKTTNLKVPAQGVNRAAKPVISRPFPKDILHMARNTDIKSSSSRSASEVASTKTTKSDAAELNRKLSNLMQQASAQEAETKRKAAAYNEVSARPTPLQRSRKAFGRATRALKERLSRSNSSDESRHINEPSLNPLYSGHHCEPPSSRENPDQDRETRLERRLAEGANLSNPKIQLLTGDGNIPRRPLPVYESMKSRTRSESLDDPFSDEKEMNDCLSPRYYSGFDFDFNKRKLNIKTADQGLISPASDQVDGTSDVDNHLAVPKNKFSNLISGLAQHPDTGFFSSSPVAHSTPQIRLEPHFLGTNKRAPSQSPSILDFSFEGRSEDEISLCQSTNSRTFTDGSLSVKRKSARANLRSHLSPAPKKARTSSKEETMLADAIYQLGTDDERAPLSPKNKNARLAPLGRTVSRGRGMSIFDVGKGKAVEGKDDYEVKRPRPRGIVGKRSSLPRPGSGLFLVGRESRAGMRRLTSMDGDSMDIDELQADDLAYQLPEKKK